MAKRVHQISRSINRVTVSFLIFNIQILRIDDISKALIASNDRAHLILMAGLSTVGGY